MRELQQRIVRPLAKLPRSWLFELPAGTVVVTGLSGSGQCLAWAPGVEAPSSGEVLSPIVVSASLRVRSSTKQLHPGASRPLAAQELKNPPGRSLIRRRTKPDLK